jgi:hypothetical protein
MAFFATPLKSWGYSDAPHSRNAISPRGWANMKTRKNDHANASHRSKTRRQQKVKKSIGQFFRVFTVSQRRTLFNDLKAYQNTRGFYVERLGLSPEAATQFLDVTFDCFTFACMAAKRVADRARNPRSS